MMVYPIPPGLFCVPSAIIALTGADLESVVIPALEPGAGKAVFKGADRRRLGSLHRSRA